MDAFFGIILAASLIGWISTRYSVFCLPFLVSLSILAQDSFYPLSHFPMYSDPDESENYLYLATFSSGSDEPEPLQVRTLTGLSAPKVKKMWKSYLRGHAEELGKKDTKLSAAERAEAGRILLDEFREMATGRSNELPESLGLVEVWIEHNPEGGWTETAAIVARQPFTGKPQPATN